MGKRRVRAFIDGFNLYHAIKDLDKPYLKWLDLWALSQIFLDPQRHELQAVYYFTAPAHWRPTGNHRHQRYIAALECVGVTPVLGHFKRKNRFCPLCQREYRAYEEKESDVNLAIWLLNEARKDSFDHALIMSGDSDIAPAVRMLHEEFPEKTTQVIAMVGRRHSKELAKAATKRGQLRELHLERSLLPTELYNAEGCLLARRPPPYDPPPQVRVLSSNLPTIAQRNTQRGQ